MTNGATVKKESKGTLAAPTPLALVATADPGMMQQMVDSSWRRPAVVEAALDDEINKVDNLDEDDLARKAEERVGREEGGKR